MPVAGSGLASFTVPSTEAQRLEDEADRFASRTLIPADYESRLPRLQVADIPAFAAELGIAPAIIVGRLQH